MAAKMLAELGAMAVDRIWLDMTGDVHASTASVPGMILELTGWI
jgi:hypothetical protein